VITLAFPPSSSEIVALFDDVLVGPIGTGSPPAPTEIRLDTDQILESKGIYGENVVKHDKTSGNVNVIPLMVDVTFLPPTSIDPMSVRYNGRTTSGSFTTLTARAGMMPSGTSGIYVSGTTTVHRIFVGSPTKFEMYYFQAANSAPFKLTGNIVVKEFELVSVVSRRCSYNVTQYGFNGTVGKLLPVTMRDPVTLSDVLSVANTVPKVVIQAKTLITPTQCVVRTPFSASVESLRYALDSLSKTALDLGATPIEEVSYGELAMRASEGVNANSVNMIAFIRDLRDPRQLMLKLRNR